MTILETNSLSIWYGEKQAINNVSVKIAKHKVMAIIGPSGCGKSTLLRTFNRMNDFVPDMRVQGEVLFQGKDIFSRKIDPVEIRRRIGMVFQRPNPFPKSVRANIVWGPKVNGYTGDMNELVESSLKRAALWDEVKDRLDDSALNLSGGQQQRLCIARAIAMQPEIILMDEPCSALDPRATSRIEDLIGELRSSYTIVIVTHNMQQAARVSNELLFFYDGELIESGETKKIFTNPAKARTQDYITGRFG
ncbi:MAG: phosphate ABC transporter ATP-binding protein [Bdellovibrionales bacterium RBG_16_40_8]|nr:MAG: phosphate ABC transporter ATP-binding protein [Bdellovibrionales bacterium RBG_16_40_8]